MPDDLVTQIYISNCEQFGEKAHFDWQGCLDIKQKWSSNDVICTIFYAFVFLKTLSQNIFLGHTSSIIKGHVNLHYFIRIIESMDSDLQSRQLIKY